MNNLDMYQQECTARAADRGQTRLAVPTVESKLAISIACMGLGGEAGEVQEIVKKWLDRGQVVDRDKLREELGDTLWYLAAIAWWAGISMSEVAQANLEKLQARYPEGFTAERALASSKDG